MALRPGGVNSPGHAGGVEFFAAVRPCQDQGKVVRIERACLAASRAVIHRKLREMQRSGVTNRLGPGSGVLPEARA